jgi:hypothetical protein
LSGNRVDCDYVIEGHTEDELYRNGEKQAFNRYGIKNSEFISYFNDELKPKIQQFNGPTSAVTNY